MSGGRVAWIIFCCLMAAMWLLFTWWTVIIPLFAVPLSLLAILLPVGKRNSVSGLQVSGGAWAGPPYAGAHPSTPAGWYADPEGSGMLRWWDGMRWTNASRPALAPSDRPPDPLPPS